MEKGSKRLNVKGRTESAGNTTGKSAGASIKSPPSVSTRINGLQKRIPSVSKSSHTPLSKESSVVERPRNTNSPHMTRLASRQAAVVANSRDGMRVKRLMNREQVKNQPGMRKQQKGVKVNSEESWLRVKEEIIDTERTAGNVEVKDMELHDDVQNLRQPEQQTLRTLSLDLALSNSDLEDDDEPIVADYDSECLQSQQRCQHEQENDMRSGEHATHNQVDILVCNSDHQQQDQMDVLTCPINEPLAHSSDDHEHGTAKAPKLHKSCCARCIKYNCALTVKRRRNHLVVLWLQQTENSFTPQIVERKCGKRKSSSYRTKLWCESIIRNHIGSMPVKVEPETEEVALFNKEIKVELAEHSYIPHHLLSTEDQMERDRSSSPDVVRDVVGNVGCSIIEEAMRVTMNGGGTADSLPGSMVAQSATVIDKLLSGSSSEALEHLLENDSSCNGNIASNDSSVRNEHMIDDNIAASCDMPIDAYHQPCLKPKMSCVVSNSATERQSCCDGSQNIESQDAGLYDVELHYHDSSDVESHNSELQHGESRNSGSHETGSCNVGSHDAVLGDAELHNTELHNTGLCDESHSNVSGSGDKEPHTELPEHHVVTTTVAEPTTPSCAKRKRGDKDIQVVKKPCVLDLRSIKVTTAPAIDNMKVIRNDKINLSLLKNQSISENDVSLREITQQKSLSLNVVKLSSDQLPAKRLWPSPASQYTISTAFTSSARKAAVSDSNAFTFNLDRVVSRAAKDFSFTTSVTTTTIKPIDKVLDNRPSVFERLGQDCCSGLTPIGESKLATEVTTPVTPSMEPITPSSSPPEEDEDILELHPIDNFFDDMTDVHIPTKPIPKKQSSIQEGVVATTANVSDITTAAKLPVSMATQKTVHFGDRPPPPVPNKHQQVTQWVNNTRTNPPPPPPGYHTPSEGSGPRVFSFPSSPVLTPATTPPNLEEDNFDSLSVQLQVPKAANAAKEDARNVIFAGNPWPRRESVTTNGISWGGPPKGFCFKYWSSGTCGHHQNCKFLHVRNPEKWWNSEGFFSEMELLIEHSVEVAWAYIKVRPPSSVPPSLLERVIISCTKWPLLPMNHPVVIQIAEDAFSRLMSQQRCPREYFFAMLKCYATHKCNTHAFWLIREMNKYGYLLSKEMAICVLSCYQPPATCLTDLISWIVNAGLFRNMYNRLAQSITMETPLQEVCALLETCAEHRVKIHYGNTNSLVNICSAHNNCEAVIRVLEVSHDPSVVSPQNLAQVLMMHTPEQLDRVTNLVVAMFPHDVCRNVSGSVWNKLLNQCCSQQRSAKAMQIFHYMSNTSMRIDKEAYMSLMMLHCSQRHPSEVLTVLQHQLRCSNDTSSVPMICQELLKHQYWDVLCDLVICIINAGHKPGDLMIQEVKNALLQNNEVNRWKSLLEKTRNIGVDLNHSITAAPMQPLDGLFSPPSDNAGAVQQPQLTQDVKKEQIQSNMNLSFSLEAIDSFLASPPYTATTPSQPHPVMLQPEQASVNSLLQSAETAQDGTAAPSSALALPSRSPAELAPSEDGVLAMVKKSIMDEQWLSLGAIIQLCPISLQLVQVVASSIQSLPNISGAFASLITSFKKFHQMENSRSASGDLTQHERDLIGQVGVSLIMNAVAMEKWQDGFHILYALHHHGIHYVTDQGGWSPCLIAMAAVECCLHLNIPPSALEVMRGAQWISSSNPTEREKRNTVLEKLVRACIAKKEIVGAEETLQAMDATAIKNELLHLVLAATKQSGKVDVYNRLSKKYQLLNVNTPLPSLSTSTPKMNLFPADKTIHFGVQRSAISSGITTVLPAAIITDKQKEPKTKRDMKTEFRQKVTKAYSQHLKRFVKDGRINNEDYIHLARVLSKRYYHRVELNSPGPWELTEAMLIETQQTVDNLFSQCTIYTKDLDAMLNLVET